MTSFQERQYTFPSENRDATMAFVEATLGTNDFELTLHDSQGDRTKIYACDTEDKRYILRHGYGRADMAKDAYAAQHFSSANLPIPQVLGIRHLNDKSALCLSERVPGDVLDKALLGTPGTELNADFSAVLRIIHTTDVTDSKGYGFAKANGQGVLPHWLFAAGAQRVVASRVSNWLAARHTTLDRASFREITALQRSLGGFCITERMLCHGDLKNNNLLAMDDHITGVIDWGRFEYNDPAYDLGIVHVRYPGAIDHDTHAQAIGLSQAGLQERVLYYAISECAVAIAFFGQQGNEAKVVETEQRLIQIADEVASL